MNDLIGSLKCISLEFKAQNESALVVMDSNVKNRIQN